MRLKNYIAIVLLGGVIHLGCTKDYLIFDKEIASLRFIYNQSEQDSITYSFALFPDKNQDTVSLPLQIIGLTSDQEREVKVDFDPVATTAIVNTNFEIQPCFIPKNSVKGSLKVVIKRTPDLETKNAIISIVLKENKHFLDPPVNESKYNIILSGALAKPSDWPHEFHPYSKTKHEFVIKITNKGADYSSWSEQELIYYMGLLNKALYEYNKNNPGNPLTDENGLQVTF